MHKTHSKISGSLCFFICKTPVWYWNSPNNGLFYSDLLAALKLSGQSLIFRISGASSGIIKLFTTCFFLTGFLPSRNVQAHWPKKRVCSWRTCRQRISSQRKLIDTYYCAAIRCLIVRWQDVLKSLNMWLLWSYSISILDSRKMAQ